MHDADVFEKFFYHGCSEIGAVVGEIISRGIELADDVFLDETSGCLGRTVFDGFGEDDVLVVVLRWVLENPLSNSIRWVDRFQCAGQISTVRIKLSTCQARFDMFDDIFGYLWLKVTFFTLCRLFWIETGTICEGIVINLQTARSGTTFRDV